MRTFVLGAVLALLAARAAATPTSPPPDPARERAKEIYNHAEALYALTKYADALSEYEKAFEVKPLPGFLFNIAQCYRQLGNFDRAIYFYKAYLDRSPKAPNMALVLSLIQECQNAAKVLSVRPDGGAPDGGATPGDGGEENAGPSDAGERLALDVPRDAGIAPVPFYKRWYVWAAGGGAIVLGLVIGLGVGLGTRGGLPGTSLGSLDYSGFQ